MYVITGVSCDLEGFVSQSCIREMWLGKGGGQDEIFQKCKGRGEHLTYIYIY